MFNWKKRKLFWTLIGFWTLVPFKVCTLRSHFHSSLANLQCQLQDYFPSAHGAFIRFQASTDANEKTDVFSRVSCSSFLSLKGVIVFSLSLIFKFHEFFFRGGDSLKVYLVWYSVGLPPPPRKNGSHLCTFFTTCFEWASPSILLYPLGKSHLLAICKKFFKISGLIPNHPLPHLLQIYSCQSYNGILGRREGKHISICHLDGSFSSLSMCSSPDCLYLRMPRSLLPRSACSYLYEPSLGYS